MGRRYGTTVSSKEEGRTGDDQKATAHKEKCYD
jgi:hypothetical protein